MTLRRSIGSAMRPYIVGTALRPVWFFRAVSTAFPSFPQSLIWCSRSFDAKTLVDEEVEESSGGCGVALKASCFVLAEWTTWDPSRNADPPEDLSYSSTSAQRQLNANDTIPCQMR